MGEPQQALAAQGTVGEHRRSARGSIHELHRLLELGPANLARDAREQVAEGDHLTGATVSRHRNVRERPAVQQARHRDGELRAHGAVPVQPVRQPREDDAAHHPVRERLAP
jgi:hypothetical protein